MEKKICFIYTYFDNRESPPKKMFAIEADVLEADKEFEKQFGYNPTAQHWLSVEGKAKS